MAEAYAWLKPRAGSCSTCVRLPSPSDAWGREETANRPEKNVYNGNYAILNMDGERSVGASVLCCAYLIVSDPIDGSSVRGGCAARYVRKVRVGTQPSLRLLIALSSDILHRTIEAAPTLNYGEARLPPPGRGSGRIAPQTKPNEPETALPPSVENLTGRTVHRIESRGRRRSPESAPAATCSPRN
ncbi:hypothetical protein GEV33_007662 [Tenebrio molitor]|uniref:Uncharacterized protein n=1 Tax=Tenebrio molitor TaxID=7067 RepID=A0A8J6HI39_TENMO|nr:hypothetical protein GEV33_007662 [Tenebrio molitor]